jgi:hypothetical protein
MKTVLILVTLAVLAGCGIETAGTAATVAAAKKKEIEQAQVAMARMQQDLEAANRQMAQRAAQAEEATK